MKKLALLMIAAFALTIVTNAQKSNVIKLNLLSPILKTGNLAYERVISEKFSVQLRGYYSATTVADQKLSGFGIIPEGRFYLANSKEAPAGFYVAPFVSYSSYGMKIDVVDDITFQTTTAEADYNVIGGGLCIGTQAVFSDIVTFEAFIGIKYTSGSMNVKAGTEDDFDAGRLSGFLPRGGITLGIAF